MQSLPIDDRTLAIQQRESLRVVRVQNAPEANAALQLIDEYCGSIGVVARDEPAALLRQLAEEQIAIWIAYVGSTAVGCVLYRDLPEMGAAGEIKRLYVRPQFRGRGVAEALLDSLEQLAAERQVEWLYLDTKDDLTDAIRFYERRGYGACERYNENWQATIFMRKQVGHAVDIRCFRAGDEGAFRRLNEAWIEKHFRLEEKDFQTLHDPQRHVLAPGGQIFVAVQFDKVIGCCALLPLEDGAWEIAKMAVDETRRGQGIGKQLIRFAIDYAEARASRRLYIETNSALPHAIRLYESVGFRHIPTERVKPSPYARANVFMEMLLER